MKRRHLLALGALSWWPTLGLAAAAQSQPPGRFALVIGNGAYNTNALPNTRPDAQLIAATLEKAGFAVSLKKDLDRSTMFEAVRRFAADLPAGSTALVYYAGHGMQISGNNYLLPVDITPTSEAGLAQRAFPLQALHERLALARSAVNIIILDACRNNPFQPVPAVRLRSYANLGLAGSSVPRGTLVAYSTAPGQLAEDGTGRKHSIYTETLAGLLSQPGLTAENLFRRLSDEVRRRTLEDQQPWYESSLAGDFYFVPPPGWRPPAAGSPAANTAAGRASPRYRGAGSIGSTGEDSWYRDMDERAWTELDFTIEQRAQQADTTELARLEKQAAKGNVVAMTTLALAKMQGQPKGARNRTAENWLRKAAKLDFPVAQTELAEQMYKGRVEGGKQEAIRLFERAALANYPRARIDLAQVRYESKPSTESMQQLLDSLVGNSKKMMKQ
ncbi:caspase family protein [Pseudoduganella sp.]|uniref:caspase family protein n=1 Tax=Pseudoduganella sp. TaxID=1880898 RepID=UPI0035B1477A